MLTEIELENFKSHRSTPLILDESRLHALVGQNSSGKTSVLQALHYMSSLTRSPFSSIFQYDHSPQFLTTIGKDNMSVIARGFWGYKNCKNWQFSYNWERTNTDDWTPRISWDVENIDNTISGWKIHLMKELEPDPSSIINSLKYEVYLKLISSNLARPAYSDELRPRVEFDGYGLAPTLDYLRTEAPDRFQEVQDKLKRIVPGVQKIDVRRAKVNINRQRSIEVNGKFISYEESQEMTGQEVVLDMNTGDRIPAHSMSEGTILSLGLLTVLMNPNQPNLILLDDIEQGLHPKAQRELMTVFKEILEDNPNLQIIFSTHSPYIIDELQPSQVHIMSNSYSGFTSCKRLDEHPDIEWAINSLTTGEFWGAEGEEWVLPGEVSV
ncbi:MAG: ATP-binding protein [Cyanobacteria bacterium J007]|nr:MAG: ATP-binding protein [Cyanobacteria bacterium J007]